MTCYFMPQDFQELAMLQVAFVSSQEDVFRAASFVCFMWRSCSMGRSHLWQTFWCVKLQIRQVRHCTLSCIYMILIYDIVSFIPCEAKVANFCSQQDFLPPFFAIEFCKVYTIMFCLESEYSCAFWSSFISQGCPEQIFSAVTCIILLGITDIEHVSAQSNTLWGPCRLAERQV